MKFGKLVLFLAIIFSLILSVFFSLKSFTGYLVSDISDVSGNMISFIFLTTGLVGTWIYLYKYKKK